MLKGYLEQIEFVPEAGWCAIGWAADDEAPDATIAVEIVSADAVIGVAAADRYREDLEQAIGTGGHGFLIPLELTGRGVEQLDLSLRQVETKHKLDHLLLAFSPLIGRLEGHRNAAVYGWACDTADPSTPVSIDILVDGRLAERIVADIQRDDLSSYFSSCYGFFWPMPEEFADGVARVISARPTNEPSLLLPGSPFTVVLEEYQVSPALRQILRRRRALLEELRLVNRNLYFHGWRSPDAQTIGPIDFLADFAPFSPDL